MTGKNSQESVGIAFVPQKEFKKAIGTVIRRWREELNLSQVELAKQVGISQGSLSLIENGERALLKTLRHIVFTLGVNLSALIASAEELTKTSAADLRDGD